MRYFFYTLLYGHVYVYSILSLNKSKEDKNECKQTYANISFNVPRKHDEQQKAGHEKLEFY